MGEEPAQGRPHRVLLAYSSEGLCGVLGWKGQIVEVGAGSWVELEQGPGLLAGAASGGQMGGLQP